MPPRLPVIVIVGTRPEAIKLVPLILALRDSRSFRPVIVSTGQHQSMVREIFDLADIQSDADLWIGDYRSRLNARVSSVLERFEDFCSGMFGDHGGRIATAEEVQSGEYPAAVLVHGDTSSAFAAALAAFHLRIPVAHVEAGLRTGGLNLSPFPEELNRQLVTCIASFHFAPTPFNQENLIHENVPVDQIFVTGNTAVDALHWASSLDLPFRNPDVQQVFDSDARIVIVTAHRRENWGGGLAGVAEGVARLADRYPEVSFVVSVHPNPLVREELADPLEGRENVVLTRPLRYAGFARLLGRCHFAITDSGGIQEEAPSLGKPVLVARESTERTEGIKAGTLRLVGTDPGRIEREASRLLSDDAAYAEMADAHNPYGDGRASQRIVAALEHILHGGDPPSPFGPGYSREAVLAATGYRAAITPEEPEPVAVAPPAPIVPVIELNGEPELVGAGRREGARGAPDPRELEQQWPTR